MLFKMYEYEVPVQDGEVEGHALISSCKNAKIATSCLITNDRWMLEPTKKKKIPHVQDKEEATVRWEE